MATPELLLNRPNSDPPAPKPTVIGVYGLPGCGKSTLLDKLKLHFVNNEFRFFEGSEELASNFENNNLQLFEGLPSGSRDIWRRYAIQSIAKKCAEAGKPGVVAGHLMLWDKDKKSTFEVCTTEDWKRYTHLVYLETDPDLICRQTKADTARERDAVGVDQLSGWQDAEISRLRSLCYENRILFTIVRAERDERLPKVAGLLTKFLHDNQEEECRAIVQKLSDDIRTNHVDTSTILVIDGDKTLVAQDTGMLFWEKEGHSLALKTMFESYKYTREGFLQAALLYEELDEEEFDRLCEIVAQNIMVRPEFVRILKLVKATPRLTVVIATCGLRRVFEKILKKDGLSDAVVAVVGGGRLSADKAVMPEVKAALVQHLRTEMHMRVWAFGDSILDMPMLRKADRAIVVVGVDHKRKQNDSMAETLRHAIKSDGLDVRQFVIPSLTTPPFNIDGLQSIDGDDIEFLLSGLKIHHATHRTSAKLLMTPTRDFSFAGPELREAHCRIGRYLATEFVSDIVGIESYAITNVHGKADVGHRLKNESKTLIVRLMRGGEPMAFGLSEAFPLAMFLHAKQPADLTLEHMDAASTIVLVDGVINNGDSILEFMQHIRRHSPTTPIVVVAGVVQAGAVGPESLLTRGVWQMKNVEIVALRTSMHKYTGQGKTDTGARLFNITELEN